jgi:hypothetical protein
MVSGGGGVGKWGVKASGRHQLLNPRHFLREFKAQLLGLIIGQPIGHLREHLLVIAKGPLVPRASIQRPLGNRQCPQHGRAHFFRIGPFRWTRRRGEDIEAKLFGLVGHGWRDLHSSRFEQSDEMTRYSLC